MLTGGRDINPYQQATATANALKAWLWSHQRFFLEGEQEQPADAFRVWPDLLVLGPEGTVPVLPMRPSNRFGMWFIAVEPWLAHRQSWRALPGSISLTQKSLQQIAEHLRLIAYLARHSATTGTCEGIAGSTDHCEQIPAARGPRAGTGASPIKVSCKSGRTRGRCPKPTMSPLVTIGALFCKVRMCQCGVRITSQHQTVDGHCRSWCRVSGTCSQYSQDGAEACSRRHRVMPAFSASMMNRFRAQQSCTSLASAP
jgi:hypothetical protein